MDKHKLEAAYNKIKLISKNVESFNTVQLVEDYRHYFKPTKVKVLLLAESHVYTSEDDTKITIPPINALPNYPSHYARFVYCLGFGENALTQHQNHPKLDGTPQYWKLLKYCDAGLGEDVNFSAVLKTGTAFEQRLTAKINLLYSLKNKGIWLRDVSITALYKTGTQKHPQLSEILKSSWQHYVKEDVIANQPNHIICIGKGVENIIGAELQNHFKDRVTVIAQPNAHLKANEHLKNLQTVSEICNKYALGE